MTNVVITNSVVVKARLAFGRQLLLVGAEEQNAGVVKQVFAIYEIS